MIYSRITSGNQTVDAMGMINISGNIIPQIWYSTITRDNGRPHLLAITLLADIVYWYRPVEVRDEQSGRVIGWKKRFKGHLLQKTYQQYADLFGESKRTIKAALDRLEELGIITKEFHDVTWENGVTAHNLMFISLDADKLQQYTYPMDSDTNNYKSDDEEVISEEEINFSSNGTRFCSEEDMKIVSDTVLLEDKSVKKDPGYYSLDNHKEDGTKFCNTPYKILQEGVQNNAGDGTKFCTTPLQKNVPSPTKFCTCTKNTTENTNINNINQSINQDNILILSETDEMDIMANYVQIVKQKIEYQVLVHDMPNEKGIIDEIVELCAEMLCVKRDFVRIGGGDYPHQVVKNRLLNLSLEHIKYVMDCMQETTTKVANIRAYLLTALFNAPATIKNYYQSAVNYDLYGI